jgi:uncharacterized tellurite resistance protein B-like protein
MPSANTDERVHRLVNGARLDTAVPACQCAGTHCGTSMLDTLRNFFADFTGKHPDRFADNDYRLAAAALLVHAATIDGVMSAAEREKLQAVLKSCFSLDDDATTELIDRATTVENEAIDLYHFTSTLNNKLNDDGRRRVIEMMWEVIYADGRLNEFEDNLVWRAADLLNVPSRDRVEIRRRVAGEGTPIDAED